MAIPVERYKRRKFFMDSTSPVLVYLRPAPRKEKLHTIDSISKKIEKVTALSAVDVKMATLALVDEVKARLVNGDRVKIDGLGIFHLTFNCEGSEDEKDCTVKKIRKVNIRFIADKSFKVVNSATAKTRSDSNVDFYIEDATLRSNGSTTDPDGDEDGNPTI